MPAEPADIIHAIDAEALPRLAPQLRPAVIPWIWLVVRPRSTFECSSAVGSAEEQAVKLVHRLGRGCGGGGEGGA